MSLTLVMLHVTFLPQFISTLPQLINSTATTIIIMLLIIIIEIVLSSSHHFFLFLSRITSHCLSYSILSNLFLYCSSNKGIKENEWKEMEGKETCCKHYILHMKLCHVKNDFKKIFTGIFTENI